MLSLSASYWKTLSSEILEILLTQLAIKIQNFGPKKVQILLVSPKFPKFYFKRCWEVLVQVSVSRLLPKQMKIQKQISWVGQLYIIIPLVNVTLYLWCCLFHPSSPCLRHLTSCGGMSLLAHFRQFWPAANSQLWHTNTTGTILRRSLHDLLSELIWNSRKRLFPSRECHSQASS